MSIKRILIKIIIIIIIITVNKIKVCIDLIIREINIYINISHE